MTGDLQQQLQAGLDACPIHQSEAVRQVDTSPPVVYFRCGCVSDARMDGTPLAKQHDMRGNNR